MNEPTPLPDDLKAYLDAAREPEPTSRETTERVMARLVPLIPPGGGGGSGGDGGGGGAGGGGAPGAGTAGAATAAVSGLLKGKLMVAAVAAALGAAEGAGLHATLAPPQTVIVTKTVFAPAVEPAPSVSVARVVSAEAPPAEAPAPSASVAVAPQPSNASASPTPRPSTMRAERILLEAANAALLRGDASAAISSLQQHKQSYPHGELAQERDILMAQAQKLKASKDAPPR